MECELCNGEVNKMQEIYESGSDYIIIYRECESCGEGYFLNFHLVDWNRDKI